MNPTILFFLLVTLARAQYSVLDVRQVDRAALIAQSRASAGVSGLTTPTGSILVSVPDSSLPALPASFSGFAVGPLRFYRISVAGNLSVRTLLAVTAEANAKANRETAYILQQRVSALQQLAVRFPNSVSVRNDLSLAQSVLTSSQASVWPTTATTQ